MQHQRDEPLVAETAGVSSNTVAGFAARLFTCNGASGIVEVEEVPQYAQDDLNSDNVHILDCLTEVYLWFGSQCRFNEKKVAVETVKVSNLSRFRGFPLILQAYIASSTFGHATSTPVFVTMQSSEPIEFRCQFPWWESRKEHHHVRVICIAPEYPNKKSPDCQTAVGDGSDGHAERRVCL